MTESAPISRSEFTALLNEMQRLVAHVNDLEYHIHALGADVSGESAIYCQQAAGALIGLLRGFLFRLDQQVLPLLEQMLPRDDD